MALRMNVKLYDAFARPGSVLVWQVLQFALNVGVGTTACAVDGPSSAIAKANARAAMPPARSAPESRTITSRPPKGFFFVCAAGAVRRLGLREMIRGPARHGHGGFFCPRRGDFAVTP